jgi:hypothetical protein
LEYFRRQEWEEEWIQVAENLIRMQYASAYDGNHKSPATAESSQASEEMAVVCSDSVSQRDLIVFHATRLPLMTNLLISQTSRLIQRLPAQQMSSMTIYEVLLKMLLTR